MLGSFRIGMVVLLLVVLITPGYGGASGIRPVDQGAFYYGSSQQFVPSSRGANHQVLMARSQSSPLIARVQENLTLLGYNPGIIDGVMGRRTQMAIMTFQRDWGLPMNGRVDQNLLTQLDKALGRTTGAGALAQPSTGEQPTALPLQEIQSFSSIPLLQTKDLLTLFIKMHPELVVTEDFAIAYYLLKNPHRENCRHIQFENVGDLIYLDLKEKARSYMVQVVSQMEDNPPNVFRLRFESRLKNYDVSRDQFPIQGISDGLVKEFYYKHNQCLGYNIPYGKLPKRFYLTFYGANAIQNMPMPRDRALAYTRKQSSWEWVKLECIVKIENIDSEGKADVKIIGARVLDYRGTVLHVFDKQIFEYLEEQERSTIECNQLTPCSLVYHVINSHPEVLTQEIIIENTADEIKYTQNQSYGNEEYKPLFSRIMVEDRDAEFAAGEFAGIYEKAVRKKAEAGAVKKVSVDHQVDIDGYDHQKKEIRFKKHYNQPQGDQKAELLPPKDRNEFKDLDLPSDIRNLHFYDLSAMLPQFDDCSFGFYSLDRRNRYDSSFPGTNRAILALDHMIKLEGLPMDPREAEKLFVKIKKGESSGIRTRVSFNIENLFFDKDKRFLFVKASLGKVELLKDGDIVMETYNRDDFENAAEYYTPTFTPVGETGRESESRIAAENKVDEQVAQEEASARKAAEERAAAERAAEERAAAERAAAEKVAAELAAANKAQAENAEERKTTPNYLNAELLDLLIVKQYPHHIDFATARRFLLDRWNQEQSNKEVTGPRMFTGANIPTREDILRIAPDFINWIMDKARETDNAFTIKVTGENTAPGFHPDQLNNRIHDKSGLSGFITGEELYRLNEVHSHGYGVEYLQWYGFSFPVRENVWGSKAEFYLHFLSKIPVPSPDVLPVCDLSECPPYGAELDVKLSRIIYNESKEGWSAYILEVEVEKARYYEIENKKKFKDDFYSAHYNFLSVVRNLEFGRLLAEVDHSRP